MSKIFISYRRHDTRDVTGRIYDRLLRHFETERIFKDVDNIAPGEDYRDVIDREIAECSLLLAVIGPSWLLAKKSDGKRRLDDPNDMVRIEIETALRRNRRVIPVVVGDSKMPEPEDLPESLKELADRHAFPVRPDPDFHRDMDRLVLLIERAMSSGEPLLAELIDPPAAQAMPPPVLLPEFLTQPEPTHDIYDSGANPFADRATGNPGPRVFGQHAGAVLLPPGILLVATCILGLAFCSLMLIGAFASSVDSGDGTDFAVDIVMRIAVVTGLLGNIAGLVAAGCMFTRKFYWVAVLGIGAMGVGTLIFCPILNLPGACWALAVLLRPEVRAAFDGATPTYDGSVLS